MPKQKETVADDRSSVDEQSSVFTRYEVFVIAILSFLQFSVVLDFMVISPLGVLLMKALTITPAQFSMTVSAYAFSAGASGLLAAGFADKYDRKKLLMFFYTGFLIGTALCAVATTFQFLMIARIVTGIFGGVIGSISFAIITDIFSMKVRGRVMGFVQMSFSASQVLGIPAGLYLANAFGWHSCFWMIVISGAVAGVVMMIYLKPINEHLKLNVDRHPLHHLFATVSKKQYLFGFLTMSLLASGGFMLMPFGSAFATHNLGLSMDQIPMLYLVTGIFSILAGPLAGKLSDKVGKYKLFCIGTIMAAIVVVVYTNLGITPFWVACAVSILLFMSITARMIPASALMTAIPDPQDRGAYMSINSATMQISGGVASIIAGLIVGQTNDGTILHYDTLGYVVVGLMMVMMIMMYFINQQVGHKLHPNWTPETIATEPI